MKKYMGIIIPVVSVLAFFALIFWVFFIVISYQRPVYGLEREGGFCGRDSYRVYDKKDGISFYSPCYDKIYMVEKRFIFNYRKDLKKYIQDGSIYSILQKASIYKWKFDKGIQTDYSFVDYNDEDHFSLVVTKCTVDGKDTYYVHGKEDNSFCRYLYQ